jgi:hypothetical protein
MRRESVERSGSARLVPSRGCPFAEITKSQRTKENKSCSPRVMHAKAPRRGGRAVFLGALGTWAFIRSRFCRTMRTCRSIIRHDALVRPSEPPTPAPLWQTLPPARSACGTAALGCVCGAAASLRAAPETAEGGCTTRAGCATLHTASGAARAAAATAAARGNTRGHHACEDNLHTEIPLRFVSLPK